MMAEDDGHFGWILYKKKSIQKQICLSSKDTEIEIPDILNMYKLNKERFGGDWSIGGFVSLVMTMGQISIELLMENILHLISIEFPGSLTRW